MQDVKFTVAVSDGAGTNYRSGGTYALDKAEADHWVGLGYAELVNEPIDEHKTPRPKKAAAPRPSSGKSKEVPVTEQQTPAPKKRPAKRTAKKTATKKTAVNRATSTAAKG